MITLRAYTPDYSSKMVMNVAFWLSFMYSEASFPLPVPYGIACLLGPAILIPGTVPKAAFVDVIPRRRNVERRKVLEIYRTQDKTQASISFLLRQVRQPAVDQLMATARNKS
ncbi:hypothetical protein RRG08_026871 [Elysia crispata]|uniref:Uncharacterized protein n=1 Tax=Elysia crispata TaxID=231223 RepID=A0AAE0Y727_9GAST|nr:hypothetical protein RRG08_026871 [Elysia crispata]